MKKDFEQAYRELAQSETPDLWDRIEAGLSEKSAPQKQKKIARLIPYTKYITVAAALLCIAILVPVLGTISRSSKGGYSGADTAVAENSAGAGAIAAPQAPAAEAPVTVDNAGSIEEGIAESTKEKVEEMEAADSMDNGAAMTEGAMLQSSECARDMEDESASEKLMNNYKELEADMLISNVVIYVTEVNRRELTEDIDEAGTLYTFLVEEEPSGVLSVGEEYVLFVPAYSSYAFMQAGVYELDLGYRESEGYSFVIERYHGEVGQ